MKATINRHLLLFGKYPPILKVTCLDITFLRIKFNYRRIFFFFSNDFQSPGISVCIGPPFWGPVSWGLPWLVAQVCHNLPLWTCRHFVVLEWCRRLCDSCPCLRGIVCVFLFQTFCWPLTNIRASLFELVGRKQFCPTLQCSPLTEAQLLAIAPCCWYFFKSAVCCPIIKKNYTKL